MSNPKILVFSGSTRAGSHNARLAGVLAKELALMDCDVTQISLADYPLPIYDGDLEAKDGVPENAQKLARLFHEHEGLVISSPEYNGSITPLLKNTIDWVSRVSSLKGEPIKPYRGKVGAIAAASPGVMGGMSMMYHLRDVLVRLGVLVISEQLALGNAGSAFDDMDNITDDRSREFMKAMCKSIKEKAPLAR